MTKRFLTLLTIATVFGAIEFVLAGFNMNTKNEIVETDESSLVFLESKDKNNSQKQVNLPTTINDDEVVNNVYKTDIWHGFERLMAIRNERLTNSLITLSKERKEEAVDITDDLELNAVDVTNDLVEVTEDVRAAPSVSIAGKKVSQELLDYYRQTLNDFGIPFWYEIGLCQMFQESGFDPLAENPNGLDKGLFQHRIIYWDSVCEEVGIPIGTDWRDPYAQIYAYVSRRAKDINNGLSTSVVISNHKTGGYGYDNTYVELVLRWMEVFQYE